jgi:thiosulfate dehydrogenase
MLFKKLKSLVIVLSVFMIVHACNPQSSESNNNSLQSGRIVIPDTTKIGNDEFGEMVLYGRNLMLNTAYYIGPKGIKGQYLGNHISCTNCHQDAGTKPFSFNLLKTHDRYPQYRAREGKVITLAERVNNCVMRPGNGRPLPLNSEEMIAFLSYLKWINDELSKNQGDSIIGTANLSIAFPSRAADPSKGALLYKQHCSNCHLENGSGQLNADSTRYIYPPLWGMQSYQPGSSMHRVIKQAQWLKANMPYGIASWQKPVLSDEEALDIAAFVNNDSIHKRPSPKSYDYPNIKHKPIDYGMGPYLDPFSEMEHKYGPFLPIIDYWKKAGLKPNY